MVAQGPGEAVETANSYHSYAQGYCLQWVRIDWEVNSLYASAIDAWNGARKKHPGDRNPPKGAPLFYRGGNYGHIVIAKESGMRSTDCPSATHVNDAALSWPETAWGDSYLGWTEDLNGVTLPGLTKSDNGDDDDSEDEDMPQYDHAKTEKARALVVGEWKAITWDHVVSGPAFEEGNPGAVMAKRTYQAVLNVAVEVPEGESVKVQTIEWTSDDGAVETNVATKLHTESGWVRASVPFIGSVGEGRRLRFRVQASADATLEDADVVVLSWGR